MSISIKTNESFGTVTINSFSPRPTEGWPAAINVTIGFEEALKLHLGIGQLLGKLNGCNCDSKASRDWAVNVWIYAAC
ncbi:MAG TPA: hypothetical protein VGM05_17600 [Planctomycetaceae bacterium]|jgi:hypothetical protein